MKADFFCTQMHPPCTQPKKKGLTCLANPLNLLAGATRIELATSGVTGFFEFNDFNNFACLLYQIMVKCVESWGASALYPHPIRVRS